MNNNTPAEILPITKAAAAAKVPVYVVISITEIKALLEHAKVKREAYLAKHLPRTDSYCVVLEGRLSGSVSDDGVAQICSADFNRLK